MSEPLKCCICLDEFTRSASLPCGHCFCLACIGEYWRINVVCQCPLCMTVFLTRPQLNTDPATVPEATVPVAPAEAAKAGEVPCDLCAVIKRRAVKSCLVCLASYCDAHLELHYQREDLGRHPLISVVKNLEGSVCRVHGKPLDRFCRSDNTCLCAMCVQTEHKGHCVISVHREAAKKKIQLKRQRTKLEQVIKEKLHQVEKIILCTGRCKDSPTEAGTEQKELVKQLEEEVSELQRRNAELEQLSHTEDDLHLLQRLLHSP